jgi:protein tyrosine/serine phosphatase
MFALMFLTWVCSSAGATESYPPWRNFHVIEPGRAYRSARLRPDELKSALDRLNIRTVINLEGAAPGSAWYEAEKKILKDFKVKHVNIEMSAARLPHRADLLKLLRTFDDAEYPILIHCWAGADRTGEASAIYAMDRMNWPSSQALRMLTPRFLHFEIKYPAKRYFIGKVYRGRTWAFSSYDPCQSRYLYYSYAQFCR